MGTEISTFGSIEIKKNRFYRHKRPAPPRDIDI